MEPERALVSGFVQYFFGEVDLFRGVLDIVVVFGGAAVRLVRGCGAGVVEGSFHAELWETLGATVVDEVLAAFEKCLDLLFGSASG